MLVCSGVKPVKMASNAGRTADSMMVRRSERCLLLARAQVLVGCVDVFYPLPSSPNVSQMATKNRQEVWTTRRCTRQADSGVLQIKRWPPVKSDDQR